MTTPLPPSYLKIPLGYFKQHYNYDICPTCGSIKSKSSKMCKMCKYGRCAITQPDDPTIRFIPLTKGQYAIVDATDYEWLNQWRWQARWNSHTKSYYASRNVKILGTSKTQRISMHRLILGLEDGNPLQGDHINTGQTLDNRRSNLRIATSGQNRCNSRRPVTNTSGYKGVILSVYKNSYIAQIQINGKHIKLGERSTAKAAHDELYVPAALKLHGKFARPE